MKTTPLLILTLTLSITAWSQSLKIQQGETLVAILKGDSPLLQYKYSDVPYKPYVRELFTPNGINILRDAPHDHLHHHGLMFAISVDGVNFWEEQQAPGQQKHIDISGMQRGGEAGAGIASFEEKIDWIDPATQRVLIQENRTVMAHSREDINAKLITWQSAFSLPEGKESAILSGSKYFGLGMRFLESMDTGGRFFNADGGAGVAGTDDKNSNWCAYTAKADGTAVTVAAFAHPSNPRSPTNWYTMDTPFAYLSATLALDVEPLVMKEDLILRYGVAVWDGEATAE